MLNIQQLTYLQNGYPLLQDINLQVFANQRIGLVGKNGCGKSTLFYLIRGKIQPDNGSINMQNGKTIAFVEQEIINATQPAIEFVLDGDIELRSLEKILAKTEHNTEWFNAQQRYEEIDGYAAHARAAQLLHGLGFSHKDLTQSVNQFSGGWRMRLNLARALMHRADLLLLDEPTNHLDLEAIIWLEQYLIRYPGSIILVSHDRDFLNACTNRIAAIHDKKIVSYTGNYDDYERTRAEQLVQQTQAFAQQQKKIAHMEDFVRRFRAKATKAKQAQSRLKALNRLNRITPIHFEDGHFQLKIDAPARSPDVLLRVKDMSFGYNQELLFNHLNLIVQAGARIALLGPNGAGKSTLIKLLIQEIKPITGHIEHAPDIQIGYFSQHQLEYLDAAATPLDHLRTLLSQQATQPTELELRKFLGRFGLGGDREDRPVGSFSGGERSRLALALIAWQKPHILLLDEPTNHLDLDMRDALTIALEMYSGAVILVSHDRSLIRMIADELWLIADGTAQPFNGDLEDYKKWIEAHNPVQEEQSSQKKEKQRNQPGINRKNLQTKQTKLEAVLKNTQIELATIAKQLADPTTYTNQTRDKIDSLNQIHHNLEQKIIQLEEEWLELEDTLERATHHINQ